MDINPSEKYPLPEGQYYHDQIIGLQVQTSEGQIIGTVTDIITGQSNDNFVVRQNEEEILIPAIEDVIKSIDTDKGLITIYPIDGLLELNAKKPPKQVPKQGRFER
jgi:16S rRNA processing protein RimM